MGRIFKYILVIAGIVLLVAAGIWLVRGSTSPTVPVVEIGKPAKVACTPDCSDYGQCGTVIEDNTKVVLAGNEPKLENHDSRFKDGVVVNVLAKTTGTMAYMQDDTQVAEEVIEFWQVEEPDIGKPPAWITQWCILPNE
jgi:hypothetical protein